MCSVCINECFVLLWNFKRIPSFGVLILTEVEVTEDERNWESSTCWQGVLVSEGHLRSPRRAGRSLPCGLCSEGTEKKSDVSRAAAATSCYFCHFIGSGGALYHHLLPPQGKHQFNQKNCSYQIIKVQTTVLTIENDFHFKWPLTITLFWNKILSCVHEVWLTDQG